MSGDSQSNDYLHQEYPKRFPRHEFWQQIKRTVNGQQVTEFDIELIIKQIESHLDLQSHNHLLDLGCGNAALASRLFVRIDKYTGVDFSTYLLGVASEYFRPNENINYIESDMRAIENYAADAHAIDKILIYGCIAYLDRSAVVELLRGLKSKFAKLERIFIGNIPNRKCAPQFFAARGLVDFDLDQAQSPIGLWWEPDELQRIGESLGFQSEVLFMPANFYGGQYRFDLLLKTGHP